MNHHTVKITYVYIYEVPSILLNSIFNDTYREREDNFKSVAST